MNRVNLTVNRLIALALGCILSAGLATAQTSLVPAQPQLPVSAYILIDANTGVVIAEQNADLKLSVASLTKVMTAYVVVDQARESELDLTAEVLISPTARYTEGSRMFLRERTRVAIEDLLNGLIVSSGNDASVALAEHVGGSEDGFVDLMNSYAARLGMKNSTFANASGLPVEGEKVYSSARDMSLLSRSLILEFPEHYEIYKMKEYTHNGITQPNRNRLLWLDNSVDGIKTGHTEAAGYCLASSAKRGDMRLISIVLNAESEAERNRYSRRLLEYGFRHFDTRMVVEGNEVLEKAPVWGGARNSVRLGPTDPIWVTLPRAYFGELQIEVKREGDIIAPVRRGTVIGKVVVSQGDKVIEEIDLTVLEDVPDTGFFGRTISFVQLFFHRLFRL